ncbi:MAG: hypothetical protein H3C43_10290 [Leptonema sp. (in: Bacteria)]|nr:hypothetical protein [Leptonema sp. (in: bacteria)]
MNLKLLKLTQTMAISVVFLASSCMKLDYSPMQDVGPILALASSSTTQYRYHVKVEIAAYARTIGIYKDDQCSEQAPNTTKTDGQQANGTDIYYDYVNIEPGQYYLAITPYSPGQDLCYLFEVKPGGSYTINITNHQVEYLLDVTSP